MDIIRPFGEGIGVRAAPYKGCMWFHLEPQSQVQVSRALGKHGGGFAQGKIRGIKSNRFSGEGKIYALHDFDLLLPRGERIFSTLAWMPETWSIDGNVNYFALDTRDPSGKVWRGLLPQVIHLLREDLKMPGLPVYPVRRTNVANCDWHEGLLIELFGSEGTGRG